MTASPVRVQRHAAVFVGNAVRAAGYRLGGFATLTPEHGQEVAAVERALKDASVVVIDAETADALPAARLERWLAGGSPPVAIAPRADGTSSRADPAERVRIQLGLEG